MPLRNNIYKYFQTPRPQLFSKYYSKCIMPLRNNVYKLLDHSCLINMIVSVANIAIHNYPHV